MQSLSLNVEVLNAEGVAIDMKDEDDDPSTSSDDFGLRTLAHVLTRPPRKTRCGEPEFQ